MPLAVVMTAGAVSAATTASLLSIARTTDVVVWAAGQALGVNRTAICRHFLATDHDELVMVDSDTVFTAADFESIVGSLDTDHLVIGAQIRNIRRHDSHEFLEVYDWSGDGYRAKQAPVTGLVPVDAVGAGFLGIQREALERIPAPWFPDRSDEDIGFCDNARRAGVTVWCHADLRVGHVKPVVHYVEAAS